MGEVRGQREQSEIEYEKINLWNFNYKGSSQQLMGRGRVEKRERGREWKQR